MKVTINPVLDWETLTWVSNDGVHEYDGPVCLCGGPSAAATANEQAQTAFYNSVTQQQSEAFAQQQDILKSIQAITLPILNAGPNQFGFTPEEDALLKSQITTNASQSETNAINAQQLRERQLSGGADVLPTGAQNETEADVKVLGEQGKAEAINQEQLAGWQAGEQRYQSALNALTGNASLLNPTSYANAATNAGESATKAVSQTDSERSNMLSSILGGVVGAGTSFLTGGLSNITGGGSFFNPNPGQPPTV